MRYQITIEERSDPAPADAPAAVGAAREEPIQKWKASGATKEQAAEQMLVMLCGGDAAAAADLVAAIATNLSTAIPGLTGKAATADPTDE